MPSIVPIPDSPTRPEDSSGVIKFTNCLLVKNNALIPQDLWISSATGKILNGQEILYSYRTAPEQIVDLGKLQLHEMCMRHCLKSYVHLTRRPHPLPRPRRHATKRRLRLRLLRNPGRPRRRRISLRQRRLACKPEFGSNRRNILPTNPDLPTPLGIPNRAPLPRPVRHIPRCHPRIRIPGRPLRRPLPIPHQKRHPQHFRPAHPRRLHHQPRILLWGPEPALPLPHLPNHARPRTSRRTIMHPIPNQSRHPRLNRALRSNLRRSEIRGKSRMQYDNAPLQRHAPPPPP